MNEPLELRAVRDGARVRLLAPDVGTFTSAYAAGALLGAGAVAGTLEQLGVRRALVLPAGVEGRVVSEPPERTRQPVGYGDVLLELDEVRATAAASPAALGTGAAVAADGRLLVRATTSGRFWHRPAPGEPAFATPGGCIRDGAPIGLLEVMKTFSHATYRATGGLPAEARVLEVLAADGADVRRGDPLLAVEPAR